jgi:hypothetical protein
MSGINLFNSQNSALNRFHELPKSLSVRNISEKEFERETKAREKLLKTEQIVQMDENLKSEEAPKTLKEKTYLSKFNQKADQNTQAPRIGKFKNILDEGITHLNPKATLKKTSTTLANKPTSILTRGPASILSHTQEAPNTKDGDGLSATDDYLKGVAIGPNTLLNTQEFKYYGFYERIREMLVERWKTHIQREIALQRNPASSRFNLSPGSKITSLIVKLNEKGQIQEIEKIGLSGIERFDNAAVLSFKEAAPFPHPPKDMIQNGSLSIRWDFVVLVDQASLFDFRVSRGL